MELTGYFKSHYRRSFLTGKNNIVALDPKRIKNFEMERFLILDNHNNKINLFTKCKDKYFCTSYGTDYRSNNFNIKEFKEIDNIYYNNCKEFNKNKNIIKKDVIHLIGNQTYIEDYSEAYGRELVVIRMIFNDFESYKESFSKENPFCVSQIDSVLEVSNNCNFDDVTVLLDNRIEKSMWVNF